MTTYPIKYYKMKAAYSIILMLCFSLVCKAQEDRGNIADSMAMVSRTKADKVLQHFDTIIAPKLLYSLDNKDFYVIYCCPVKLKRA